MKYTGNDINRLIPQRQPFVMVDTLELSDADSAATTLVVRNDNYFLLPDGTMAETGLIEHIAQSCSALAGARQLSDTGQQAAGNGAPPVGLIGEVKHFECRRRPQKGEVVHTVVSFGLSFGNVTVATGKCCVGSDTIAEAKLKIFMQ